MICPECAMNVNEGMKRCPFCGSELPSDFADTIELPDGPELRSVQAKPDTVPDKKEKPSRLSKPVDAAIYKLICISMGLCLVAGSVVWASLFLRDRIDSPNIKQQSAQTDEPELSEAQAAATATSATTATTTTTTTEDPFKQAVNPEFIDNYGTMYVTIDSLAIRIGPGYDYTKLDDAVPSATALSVTAEQLDPKSGETWCYIDYNGSEGWVCKSYLSDKNPTIAVVLPDEFYTGSDRTWITVIRSGGLKMYSGPGDSYDVIVELPENAEIRKQGYNYFSVKWIYVDYDGQEGWIASYDGDWFNPTIKEPI